MSITARLRDLGIDLPAVPGPFGAYVPARRVGQTVVTAGQLPVVDGSLLHPGKVGDAVTPEQAAEAARAAAINALAAAATVVDLDSLAGVARVGVFVASEPGFTDQPAVANGASGLLHEVFAGDGHARAAVGVAVLPKDACVEVEVTFVLA